MRKSNWAEVDAKVNAHAAQMTKLAEKFKITGLPVVKPQGSGPAPSPGACRQLTQPRGC